MSPEHARYAIGPIDEETQPVRVVPGYGQTAQRTPALPLQHRPLTLSELTGPTEQAKRLALTGGDMARRGADRAIGQLIQVRLRIVDEDGTPMRGAMLEVWQANAAGRYLHPNDDDHAPLDPHFCGSSRLLTDEIGAIEIRTIKPGAYPVPDTGHWWRPPHIHFSVWGKLWLSRLVTQMFFPGEPLNDQDRILQAVPNAEARERLIARAVPVTEGSEDALAFEHRIVVRGGRVTPAM
jgi:protocatechuate 3,4-dioxygenase beta subunit